MQPTDKDLQEFNLWYCETKSRDNKFLTQKHIIRSWEEWKAIDKILDKAVEDLRTGNFGTESE